MRWEGWAVAILVDGCGGLVSGQYGGQNARTSKHSAMRRMGWCNPGGVLWRHRVRSICVAKIQRFPSILNSFARLGCRLGRLGRVLVRLGSHAGGEQRRGASPLFPPACDLWRRWRVILRSWRLLWRFWRVVWCSWRTSWRPPEGRDRATESRETDPFGKMLTVKTSCRRSRCFEISNAWLEFLCSCLGMAPPWSECLI